MDSGLGVPVRGLLARGGSGKGTRHAIACQSDIWFAPAGPELEVGDEKKQPCCELQELAVGWGSKSSVSET